MSYAFSKRSFIIGAAIGSGTTALAAERGGADLLLAISAGRLRNMGAPSIACMLPIFDAARLTEEFARREVLTQCNAPVLLGVDVWGALFEPCGRAREILDAGFAGAVNFPSSMLYSRRMQQILSRAGRGIESEVEQLRSVQDVGLSSMFYCANRTQARLAADAGIDLICLNLGWNVGGAFGHQPRATLEEVAMVAREIGRLVKRINPNTRFLLEGGPIETAEDLARIISLADIDGYVGGSTIERIPLENSVAEQIDRFRRATRRNLTQDTRNRRLVNWGRSFGLVGQSKAQLDFLRRLKSLSVATEPLLILAESGSDLGPVLAVISNGAQSKAHMEMVQIDVGGEEFSGRARNLLFGHSGSPGSVQPALSDDSLALVLVRSAELLPAVTQVRFARALRDRQFRITGTRRKVELMPRVVVICEALSLSTPSQAVLEAVGMQQTLIDVFAGKILRVPPLRERIDDMMEVVEHLSPASAGMTVTRESFTASAVKRLSAHRWPGNEDEVRELLGTLAGRASTEPVQRDEILLDRHSTRVHRDVDPGSERALIIDALWRHGFNRTRAAESLGVSRKTLYNKIRKYDLAG